VCGWGVVEVCFVVVGGGRPRRAAWERGQPLHADASLLDGWLPAPHASLLTLRPLPSPGPFLQAWLDPFLREAVPGMLLCTVSLLLTPPFSSSPGPLLQAWLDPFLRETVSGMLLWPRRMVVPLLPEEQTGPLDELYLRWVYCCTT
jgi:hypothetical protein